MPVRKDKYFIAIVPPEPLASLAQELKIYFSAQYQSKGALNSPPHITLHMPFEWRTDKETELQVALENYSSTQRSVSVALNGFGFFPARVVFIHVNPSEELERLQLSLKKFCRQELGLLNADYKDLPFHPHITLAFRDLRKAQFELARNEFKGKPFDGNFLADKISLLKHNGKKWNVLKGFPLTGLIKSIRP
ncbi:MAG TPA: 2'-5' RNA ligase family protein [Cyclobacteriaceae bacterium]|nr:2'-5' RNA ligase family protein [Cyclobacteriaceae bacterium]